MIGRSSIGINCTQKPNRLSLFRSTILVCLGATLSLSLPVHAIEWGPIYLGAGVDRFFFTITVLDVPASETDHVFKMYTKLGAIIVQPNQEEFSVVLDDTDASIVDGPQVTPLGTPDFDRWKDGTVTDLAVSKSEAGDWTISGAINNGTQPYVPGDQLGELRFSYLGGILGFGSPLIGAPPEASMYVTKTSSTQRVKRAGQVVPYEYVVFNAGQIILHDVALSDDNVDETPVCAFSGEDQLAVEGEPGYSVVCTAQHTVTQEEFDAGGTLDNTVTATSDEAQPVTASFSIPIVVFADGFESPANIITSLDEYGGPSSIAIGDDGAPVISYRDANSQTLNVAKCTSTLCTAASIVVVDSLNDTGWYSSIAIGSDGLPVISYYDRTAGALKVTHCNDVACKFGDETIVVVDDESNAGRYTSLAIGHDGMPVISYQGGSGLKVVKCNDVACAGGDETITRINDFDNTTGLNTSITIGADSFPVISYQEQSGPFASMVRVAKCNDAACTGADETITTLDITGAAMFESTAIAMGSDDLPVIAYFDSLDSAIKFIKCNDVACDGEDEAVSILDSLAASQRLSLVIDDDGLPVVAYAALRVVRCNDDACSGDDETIGSVDNYGLGGSTSITIGDDGLPVISYSAPGLRVVHCGTVSCQ